MSLSSYVRFLQVPLGQNPTSVVDSWLKLNPNFEAVSVSISPNNGHLLIAVIIKRNSNALEGFDAEPTEITFEN